MSPTRTPTIARTAGARSAVRALAGGLAALALGGCTAVTGGTNWTNFFMPYRIEIVQGNVVTSEQLARVGEGMSRNQVRDVLGTPLLADLFHAERWDYVFMITRGGAQLNRLGVTVYFDGDKVARVESSDLPTDAEFIETINPLRGTPVVPVLALTPEQIKALPLPPPPTAAASAPDGPQRIYPPLEPGRG